MSRKKGKKMEWSLSFIPDENQDAALIVMSEAQKHFPFDSVQTLNRRLAVHEAVLNALKYGGGETVLKAFGKENEMRVEISQKNVIVWPDETAAYRGTALIRRYAREVKLSEDKRTLILFFY